MTRTAKYTNPTDALNIPVKFMPESAPSQSSFPNNYQMGMMPAGPNAQPGAAGAVPPPGAGSVGGAPAGGTAGGPQTAGAALISNVDGGRSIA